MTPPFYDFYLYNHTPYFLTFLSQTTMKEKFLKNLEAQLIETMSAARTGTKISDTDKYRCEGFMQAGVELDLVTDEEIQALIKVVHLRVYGETIVARRGKKKLGNLH